MSIENFIKSAEKKVKKDKEITETSIENEFVEYAKRNGCKALKLVYLHGRGFPDRTVICPEGRVFFIEFKRKNKKQSANQKSVQKMLESFGFEYYVCDVMGQAEQMLDRFITRNKRQF